jgi:DNA-binding CsgD family transcriptional regulator
MVTVSFSRGSASFEGSLLPMLVANDQRRYVDANRAACLLLRLPLEQVLELSIDALTPPEFRERTTELWQAFLREGSQSGTFELLMPDGARVLVDYSATANVRPGRHLSVLSLPTREHERDSIPVGDLQSKVLTERELEVLTLVAMGERSAGIAFTLGISPATVEAHVRSCLAKLGAANRAHAVTIGLQRGEIDMLLAEPRSAQRR